MNVVKAKVLSKPGLGAQINWGHPLAIGLDSCLLFNGAGSKPIDIAAPQRSWSVRGGTVQATIQASQGVQQLVADMSANSSRAYVPAPGFPLNSGSWTCRLRVKFVAPGSAFTAIGWCVGGGSTDAGFATRNLLGMGTFSVASGEFDQTAALTANVWYDEIWSFDSGTGKMTMYLNGVLARASFTAVWSATPISTIFNTTSAFSNFTGWCDLWMHWSRALSASEASWLFAEPYVMLLPPSQRIKLYLGSVSSDSYVESLRYRYIG